MAAIIHNRPSIIGQNTQSECMLKHRNKAESLRLDINLSLTRKAKKVTIRQLDASIVEILSELQKIQQSKYKLGYLNKSDLQQKQSDVLHGTQLNSSFNGSVRSTITSYGKRFNPALAKNTSNPYPVSFKDKRAKTLTEFKSSFPQNKNQSNDIIVPVLTLTTPSMSKDNVKPQLLIPPLPSSFRPKRSLSYSDVELSGSWLGRPEAISSIRRSRKSTAELKETAHKARTKESYNSRQNTLYGSFSRSKAKTKTSTYHQCCRSVSPLSVSSIRVTPLPKGRVSPLSFKTNQTPRKSSITSMSTMASNSQYKATDSSKVTAISQEGIQSNTSLKIHSNKESQIVRELSKERQIIISGETLSELMVEKANDSNKYLF